MRTRKVSVLLADDAAVQFDLLNTILGFPVKTRKQGDADAALLNHMLAVQLQITQHLLAKSGKQWAEPEDVKNLIDTLLMPVDEPAATASAAAPMSDAAEM
ncbi:hypothetical protein [Dechloromonas sp. ZS-1]|uniref:hypothetical protein n=1 Tax=Dechloromonas sp. ZS-1 TaxID=3138067 RepID=UPI0031FD18A9